MHAVRDDYGNTLINTTVALRSWLVHLCGENLGSTREISHMGYVSIDRSGRAHITSSALTHPVALQRRILSNSSLFPLPAIPGTTTPVCFSDCPVFPFRVWLFH